MAKIVGALMRLRPGSSQALVHDPALAERVRACVNVTLRACLAEHGVGTDVYHPIPLHLQPCFAPLAYREGDFPGAERAAAEALALAMYPELSEAQQRYVVEQIADFYR